MLTKYKFGSIMVDGQRYTSDLTLCVQGRGQESPMCLIDSWWRAQGHCVNLEDIEAVVAQRPAVLVIGTGAMGMMRVPTETCHYIEELGIDLHVERTAKAVERFNNLLDSDNKVAIAMHLTC